jgi:hypothetical protein
MRERDSPPLKFKPPYIMNDFPNLALMSVVEYCDLLEGMALINGSTPAKVNFDYCFWYGAVSEERFEEAIAELVSRGVESWDN